MDYPLEDPADEAVRVRERNRHMSKRDEHKSGYANQYGGELENDTPDMLRVARAELVATARHAFGLSLNEMADMLGYVGTQRRQQVDDLETGRRPLREPQRRLIEAYLAGYRPGSWPVETRGRPFPYIGDQLDARATAPCTDGGKHDWDVPHCVKCGHGIDI